MRSQQQARADRELAQELYGRLAKSDKVQVPFVKRHLRKQQKMHAIKNAMKLMYQLPERCEQELHSKIVNILTKWVKSDRKGEVASEWSVVKSKFPEFAAIEKKLFDDIRSQMGAIEEFVGAGVLH